MTDIVERVAKAIYEADDPWSEAFEWPTMGSKEQSADNYRRIARAAIEAMGEPTDAMKDAACDVGPDTNSGEFSHDDAYLIYKTMIQKALK